MRSAVIALLIEAASGAGVAAHGQSQADSLLLLPQRDEFRATPNPVPPGTGVGSTRISWYLMDALEGRVTAVLEGGEEKLLARGSSGTVEVDSIKIGGSYEFRLYGGSDELRPRGTLVVERTYSGRSGVLMNVLLLAVICGLVCAGAIVVLGRWG